MKHYEIQGGTIEAIALVNYPAIERYFTLYNDRIVAPVIIPEQPIYRKDDDGSEYYVSFTPQAIEKMVSQFNYQCGNVFNLMHNNTMVADSGIELHGLFITSKERGIMPPRGYEQLPDGTLYADIRIINNELLSKIKQGALNGFSIEGVFELIEKQ